MLSPDGALHWVYLYPAAVWYAIIDRQTARAIYATRTIARDAPPPPRSQSDSRVEHAVLLTMLIALRSCNIRPLCPVSRARRHSATRSKNITLVSSQRQVSLAHAGLPEIWHTR